jgi:hypothetical protein
MNERKTGWIEIEEGYNRYLIRENAVKEVGFKRIPDETAKDGECRYQVWFKFERDGEINKLIVDTEDKQQAYDYYFEWVAVIERVKGDRIVHMGRKLINGKEVSE